MLQKARLTVISKIFFLLGLCKATEIQEKSSIGLSPVTLTIKFSMLFTMTFMSKNAKLPFSSVLSIVNSNFLRRSMTFLSKFSDSLLTVKNISSRYLSNNCWNFCFQHYVFFYSQKQPIVNISLCFWLIVY